MSTNNFQDTRPLAEQHPKILLYLLPRMGSLLWAAAFWGVLLLGRRLMNADGDLALHLSMGRFMLDQGRIPLEDVFSHTLAGQPAAQHKWLAQLLFGAVERLFGLDGVVLLGALVIAAAIWLVFKRLRADRAVLSVALLVSVLTLVVSRIHWLIRPHVLTFLLLALWVLALDQLSRGKTQRWWLLPVIMVLWVNTHGGFIAGLVTWLLYGLGTAWDVLWGRNPGLPARFWHAYLLGGGTAVLVTLLNPTGVGLWRMLVTHLGSAYLAGVTQEFQSPNFHHLSLRPFLILIGLLVIVLGLTDRRFKSGLVLTSAAWLLMGLYSGRNIPLFAIVSAPLLAQGLEALFGDAAARFALIERLKLANGRITQIDAQLKGFIWPLVSVLIAAAGLGLGFRFDYQGLGYDFDPEVFPVAAVDWLLENPQAGEMFNSFTWGGYLQYRLWPEVRVFIDSNSDFYGEDFVRQYVQVITLEAGWEDVLVQYNVAWSILPVDLWAAKAIQADLGWVVIYVDETAVILRRE